jgi:hypothetical protein
VEEAAVSIFSLTPRDELRRYTGGRVIDITGQRFGILTAIRLVRSSRATGAVWEFACDCGALHQTTRSRVERGECKSCGCSRGAFISLHRSGLDLLGDDARRERFFSNVERVTESGCWIWMASLGPQGYGVLRRGGKRMQAHRYSLELVNGPVPVELHVLHHCDVRPCVNPAHLYAGTQLQNVHDAIRRGRFPNCGARRHG